MSTIKNKLIELWAKPKKREGKFKMEKLVLLYKSNLDEARIYLYDNMWVFLEVSKYFVPPELYDDTLIDLYMRLDKCIQWAVKKDKYKPKQIYNYVKMITNGHLINCGFGKKFLLQEDHMRDETSDIPVEFKKWEIEADFIMDCIHEYVIWLDEPRRSVMIMKLFPDKKRRNSEIGKLIGMTSQEVSELYRKTKYQLKMHLIDENIRPWKHS